MSDSDRINEIDSRLRTVEGAIIELGILSRWMKVLVTIVGLGLGVDVTGFGV